MTLKGKFSSLLPFVLQGLFHSDSRTLNSAMWNCLYSIHLEFMSGKRLLLLEESCEQYALHMEEVRQNEALLLTASIWRPISKLIGKDSSKHIGKDSTKHIGKGSSFLSSGDSTLEASSETNQNRASPEEMILSEEFRQSSTNNQSRASPEEILSQDFGQSSPVFPFFDRVAQNMLLAYERKYVDGAEMSIKRGNEFLGNFPYQAIAVWDIFLRGVCLFGAARETKKRRYKRHARKIRATVDKWLDQGNPNVRHHSALFAAEDLALRGKFKEAQRSYESAIAVASRGGYIHDRAIAHERYALHLLQDLQDTENASYHATEADRMYREWGAYSLCSHKTPTSVHFK